MVATTQPRLPIEVIDMILQRAEAPALPSAVRSNSWIGALACKALYRFVDHRLSASQTIVLLKTLSIGHDARTDRHARIPLPSIYVRALRIDFAHHFITANLLRLVRRALSMLTDLRDLNLEFTSRDSRSSLAWVLEGCTAARARLERFSTSIRCDAALAGFLENQPLITELSLRGFQLADPPSNFSLTPTALPQLASFRVVHAGTPVLAIVLSQRPVEAVGFTLFREDCYQALDTLALSAKPIRRLTVLSLDESENTRPATLISALASRMPSLEALHIIILLASYSAVRAYAVHATATRTNLALG